MSELRERLEALSAGGARSMAATGPGSHAVRRAGADDLAAVLQVLAQNQAVTPSGWHATEPPVPSQLQRATWDRVLGTADLTVYLTVTHGLRDETTQDEVPVGTAAMVLMPHLTYDCRPSAFVEAVVVAYEHRRRGVGAMLVRQVIEDARAACCRKVQLLSHKRHADDGAHRLYQAVGFHAEAEGFRLYL